MFFYCELKSLYKHKHIHLCLLFVIIKSYFHQVLNYRHIFSFINKFFIFSFILQNQIVV